MNAQDCEAQLAQMIANLLYARDDAPVYQLHHRAAQAAIAAADADLRARLAAAEKALADERAKYAAASQRVGLATVQALDEALGRLAAAERIANYEREQRQENLDALRAAERSLAAAEAREARLVGALQRAQADIRGGIPTATGGWWNSPAAWDASRRIDAALTTDGSALAQAIEGVLRLGSVGVPSPLAEALAALAAEWRDA